MSDKNINQNKYCGWPYFVLKPSRTDKNANELVIVAECATNFSTNFYNDFIQNKNVDLICPKLDEKSQCLEKLAELIKQHEVDQITTVKLNLKCCGYLTTLVKKALKMSGKEIPIIEKIMDQNGKSMN